MKITEVNVKDIFCDDNFNCRGAIIPIDVIDLSKSIEVNGLQQPIVIQNYDKVPGKKYRIVSGHRRYTAFRVLGWEKIPSIIQNDLTELAARKLNLEENLKRKDLNLMQEANAIRPFWEAKWTIKEIAEYIQQPANWVQARLNLLKLPKEIQDEAAAGFLTQEHVRQIASMRDKSKQFEAVKKIKTSKLLGEKRKILVTEKKSKPSTKRRRDREEIFKAMEIIRDIFGNGLTTRFGAWCAGEITDEEFDETIRREALKVGKIYNKESYQ